MSDIGKSSPNPGVHTPEPMAHRDLRADDDKKSDNGAIVVLSIGTKN